MALAAPPFVLEPTPSISPKRIKPGSWNSV